MTTQRDRHWDATLGKQITVEQAEWAVLAGLIEYPDRLHEVAALVSSADWTSDGRARMYSVILSEAAQGRMPNRIDTPLALFRQANGANMSELMDHAIRYTPSSSADLVRHAERVADGATERRVVEQLRDGMEEVRKAPDIVATVQGIASSLMVLASRQTGQDADAEQAVSRSLDALRERMTGREEPGISTGLAEVDRIFRLRPGKVYVIAARPAMGKSAFVANMVRASGHVKAWGIISQEMDEVEWADRMICAEAQVDMEHYTDGYGSVTAAEIERINQAAERIEQLRLVVDPRSGLTWPQVEAKLRGWHALGLLDVAAIDYLQLIQKHNPRASTLEHITEVTQRLKALARQLQVPIVLLSQLNRECEKRPDKRPLMADLRDSGSIEQDADVVAFLYREHVYDETFDPFCSEVIVRKQRGGKTGTALASFEGRYCRFDAWGER